MVSSPINIVYMFCAVSAVWFAIEYCKPTVKQATQDKLILTWVPFFRDSFFGFGQGDNAAFEAAGCDITACRIISDVTRLRPERYNAILFHGFEYYTHVFGSPNGRTPNQLYVYLTWEPQHHSEIPWFRSEYFNMTLTYRLDSDIPWPYYLIVDRWSEEVIAPSTNPNWDFSTPNEDINVEKEIETLVNGKERPAAWVASNCNSDSNREQYVNELRRYGIQIDGYGRCGTMTCIRNEHEDCTLTIAQKYYFYLVFENSYCFDYVTEKLVIAMHGGAVPVVLNGANLTRFLPPGSYLDARELGPKRLAAEMMRLIRDQSSYKQFFWWRARYRISRNEPGAVVNNWPRGRHPFCELCAILHSKQSFQTARKKTEVRNWWHTMPDSENSACFYKDWKGKDLIDQAYLNNEV